MLPAFTGWRWRNVPRERATTGWLMRECRRERLLRLSPGVLILPVVSKSRGKEATAHFGWMTHLSAIDGPASSVVTQKRLGWRPAQPGLIADIDSKRYFEESPAAAHG
ncbi:MAG TPA: hypothetical protein VKW06_00145 [Candidatus Angelobacter sp.]|nr:hypothetical protein [Candidatus Angelobacter sp.]